MAPRIAVVEDEASLLEMLRDLLEDSGFAVLAFNHPDRAKAIDTSSPPNLFLIDLMLPGKDGIELARQLRGEGFPTTPMIAMSASKAMIRMASTSGLFQDTIDKPFEMTKLLDCVERYVACSGLL